MGIAWSNNDVIVSSFFDVKVSVLSFVRPFVAVTIFLSSMLLLYTVTFQPCSTVTSSSMENFNFIFLLWLTYIHSSLHHCLHIWFHIYVLSLVAFLTVLFCSDSHVEDAFSIGVIEYFTSIGHQLLE